MLILTFSGKKKNKQQKQHTKGWYDSIVSKKNPSLSTSRQRTFCSLSQMKHLFQRYLVSLFSQTLQSNQHRNKSNWHTAKCPWNLKSAWKTEFFFNILSFSQFLLKVNNLSYHSKYFWWSCPTDFSQTYAMESIPN